jgi:hypothetical protein
MAGSTGEQALLVLSKGFDRNISETCSLLFRAKLSAS